MVLWRPPRVAERLDVNEVGKRCMLATVRDGRGQACIGFERAPKRIHRGIVVTVTYSVHAAFDASSPKCIQVLGVAVLATAVGVVHKRRGWEEVLAEALVPAG